MEQRKTFRMHKDMHVELSLDKVRGKGRKEKAENA
jgi:hypothetical protein